MTRRLKVLHVGKFYPPHLGGIESHVELLARATAPEADVEVVVSNDGPRTVREVVDGIPVTRIGVKLNLSSASFGPGMAKVIRAADADVVHFHHPNPPAVLSYLAAKPRGALVVTYHSDIVRQRVLGPLISPLLRHFLGRADAIIASSPQYAATSAMLRRHAERVRVIPFGIDAAELATVDADEVRRLRERYGPRIVLGAGRLVYYKGFEYLVRAMTHVDAHLLIAGEGPLRAGLERAAAEAGVAHRVTLLGRVPDLRPLYHAASVFAFPSVARSEAFGIVQMEAMACGLPVVNTALDSGVPFVSPHQETGLTVPPENVDALAVALNQLFADDALRARLGAAGRARVAGELSAERMARRTLDLYHHVAHA
ncbi:MAG TPA: glycosyltransferase [Longimicrobiaceae bacterium]|nr:glycosyltransferase [Longimicrobiaceae bacterium]